MDKHPDTLAHTKNLHVSRSFVSRPPFNQTKKTKDGPFLSLNHPSMMSFFLFLVCVSVCVCVWMRFLNTTRKYPPTPTVHWPHTTHMKPSTISVTLPTFVNIRTRRPTDCDCWAGKKKKKENKKGAPDEREIKNDFFFLPPKHFALPVRVCAQLNAGHDTPAAQ